MICILFSRISMKLKSGNDAIVDSVRPGRIQVAWIRVRNLHLILFRFIVTKSKALAVHTCSKF